MKQVWINAVIAVCTLCLLMGCGVQPPQETAQTTTQTAATTVPPVSSQPTTVPTTAPAPEHSDLYIPGVSVEDVIQYFNEVCLAAEFVNEGDPSLLQKWASPIQYMCFGTYTEADKAVLDGFVAWLNTIEGFPGMVETDDPVFSDLALHFYGADDYLAFMGDNFIGTDGGVTFYYNGANQIYDATIAYRTDIDQEVRNSVILEEIYNGLGPMNDTALRTDSIIFGGYSTPQALTAMDELILKLLYHPQMQCGMDAAACEAVIRQLYY